MLRADHQARAFRIQFDVAHGARAILLIQRGGKKAALPEMTHAMIAAIAIAGLLHVSQPERPRQGEFVLRHGNEMNMIGHQAIGPDR